jgi:hypothetical protein
MCVTFYLAVVCHELLHPVLVNELVVWQVVAYLQAQELPHSVTASELILS